MQNAGIAALGLNWRYAAFEVHPNDLATAIAGAKAMKFIGLNLTVPHKLLAVGMVDVLDVSAKTWGAVNTIRFETKNKNGDWVPLAQLPGDEINEIRSHGFNTDADAITRSVQEDLGVELSGASVLLLGAGGAGRALSWLAGGEHHWEQRQLRRHLHQCGQRRRVHQRHGDGQRGQHFRVFRQRVGAAVIGHRWRRHAG